VFNAVDRYIFSILLLLDYCIYTFLCVYIYFSIVMEPITLLSIYVLGMVIGSIGVGYYVNTLSKRYYQQLEQYLDDNFVLHF